MSFSFGMLNKSYYTNDVCAGSHLCMSTDMEMRFAREANNGDQQ